MCLTESGIFENDFIDKMLWFAECRVECATTIGSSPQLGLASQKLVLAVANY
jgi:hypothetical protein